MWRGLIPSIFIFGLMLLGFVALLFTAGVVAFLALLAYALRLTDQRDEAIGVNDDSVATGAAINRSYIGTTPNTR